MIVSKEDFDIKRKCYNSVVPLMSLLAAAWTDWKSKWKQNYANNVCCEVGHVAYRAVSAGRFRRDFDHAADLRRLKRIWLRISVSRQ